MQSLVRHIIRYTYKPLLERYLSRPRQYSYKGLVLDIPPEVFHPRFFGSTGLLLRHLQKLEVKAKTVLELGAGSGLLSMVAARKGALVTATDINRTAIRYLLSNKVRNGVALSVIQSDLFQAIPQQCFDVVLINPPYYRGQPRTEKDYAWYCGENGDYFEALFQGLAHYTRKDSKVYMTLCEGCAIEWICERAGSYGWTLQCVHTRLNLVERHYLFQLKNNLWADGHKHG
jgi:release factor glutamine methyltransferase